MQVDKLTGKWSLQVQILPNATHYNLIVLLVEDYNRNGFSGLSGPKP